ncbi:MAG TPA: hypothetical protein VNY05_44445 [Candidatus Acidoferrales bacterium]|nr:hypothetical protein [Candidatus Acidoferrales bacterium]
MLNLSFDVTDTDGRFQDYSETSSGNNVLTHSKVWLQLFNSSGIPTDPTLPTPPSTDPCNPFSPWTPDNLASGQQWKALAQDGSILLSKANPGHIGVRIVTNSPEITVVEIAAVFGREPRAYQPYSSPFTLNRGSSLLVCCVFVTTNIAANSGSAWYLDLGPIANAPAASSVSLSHHYDFTVAASVNNGSYTFGHDPEMDVTC